MKEKIVWEGQIAVKYSVNFESDNHYQELQINTELKYQ